MQFCRCIAIEGVPDFLLSLLLLSTLLLPASCCRHHPRSPAVACALAVDCFPSDSSTIASEPPLAGVPIVAVVPAVAGILAVVDVIAVAGVTADDGVPAVKLKISRSRQKIIFRKQFEFTFRSFAE